MSTGTDIHLNPPHTVSDSDGEATRAVPPSSTTTTRSTALVNTRIPSTPATPHQNPFNQTPLIEVVRLSNRIQLDNVYLNGLHALKRIEVRNIASVPVLVKLRSSLGSQIAFQLTNENLAEVSSSEGTAPCNRYATNAVAPNHAKAEEPAVRTLLSLQSSFNESHFAASKVETRGREGFEQGLFSNASPSFIGSMDSLCLSGVERENDDEDDVFVDADENLSSFDIAEISSSSTNANTAVTTNHFFNSVTDGRLNHQFNQLFNYVDHVEEVAIPAGKTQQVIIAFLPDDRSATHKKIDQSETEPNSGVAITNRESSATGGDGNFDLGVSREEDETHDFFEVNGFVFFYVYRLDSEVQNRIMATAPSAAVVETAPSREDTNLIPGSSPESQRLFWVSKRRPLLISSSGPFSRKSSEDNSSTGIWAFNPYTAVDTSLARPHSPPLLPSASFGFPNDLSSVNNMSGNAPSLAELQSASSNVPTNKLGGADYQCTVKFRSRVCRSALWTDVGESGIDFDDCIAGEAYFRDFTLWNRSEIDLYWCLNTVDLSNIPNFEDTLRFSDCETGEPLDLNEIEPMSWSMSLENSSDAGESAPVGGNELLSSRISSLQKPIPAYSQRRIRVTFIPKHVGEFNYDLQLENANDSSNVVESRIRAVVRSAGSRAVEESLVVSSGTILDFGDCCAGLWAKQHLILRNVGEWPLEIKFVGPGDDGTMGAGEAGEEVVFDLVTDADGMEQGYSEPDFLRLKKENASFQSAIRAPAANHSTAVGLPPLPNQALIQGSIPVNENDSAKANPILETTTPQGILDKDGISLNGEPISPSLSSSRASSPPPSRQREGSHASASSIVIGSGRHDGSALQGVFRSSSSKNTVDANTFSWSHEGRRLEKGHGVESTALAKVGHEGITAIQTLRSGRGEMSRIEELVLKPGTERSILVSYRPRKDASLNEYKAGKLVKRTFRISLMYCPLKAPSTGGDFMTQRRTSDNNALGTGASPSGKPSAVSTTIERKIIQCKARTCTSFIAIQPSDGVINFGDADVGVLTSTSMTITNRSEMPAHVELRFISKVLNAYRDPITITPNNSVEVKIDIHPRKVNPDYRKQITVVNLQNRDDDKIMEVRAVNIDKHRVTFHSLFYRVVTREGTNWLDFGAMVLNCPKVRTLTVDNISKKRSLTVEITTSLPGELCVYRRMAAGDRELEREREKTRGRERELIALTQQESTSSFPRSAGSTHTLVSAKAPLTPSSSNVDSATTESALKHAAEALSAPSSRPPSTSSSRAVLTPQLGIIRRDSLHDDRHFLNKSAIPNLHTSSSALMTSSTAGSTAQDSAISATARMIDTSAMSSSTAVSGKYRAAFSTHHGPQHDAIGVFPSDATSDYLDLASSRKEEVMKSPRRRATGIDKNVLWGAKGVRKALFGASGSLGSAGVNIGNVVGANGSSAAPADKVSTGTSSGSTSGAINALGSERRNRQISFDGHAINTQIVPRTRQLTLSASANEELIEFGNPTAEPTVEAGSANEVPAVQDSRRVFDQQAETAGRTLDGLVTALEMSYGSAPPLFPRPTIEDHFVRSQIILQQELDAAIRDGRLAPTSLIEIPAASEVQLVLVFMASGQNRPTVEAKPRKLDARVYIRLVDFDREIKRPEFESLLSGDGDKIPVRELMVRSSVCRSMMDLGQKNINFGIVGCSERRQKRIVIRNRSETPLLYAIKKSGSIASGDIKFEDSRFGVVRGYAKREVEFTFRPTLAGQFHEYLTIENVRDVENNQIVSLKAHVRKQTHFFIKSLDLDFGPVLANSGMAPQPRQIVITNTGKATRTYEVRVEPQELKFQRAIAELDFVVEERDQGSTAMSTEILERIEVLEQKLKIADRKGRKDKVKKIAAKLQRLRRGELEDPPVGEGENDADNVVISSSVSRGGGTLSPVMDDDVINNGDVTVDDSPSVLQNVMRAPVDQDRETVSLLPSEVANLSATMCAQQRSGPTSRRSSLFSIDYQARLSDAAKESGSAARSKKTANGIVFSVDGDSTKTIWVYLKAFDNTSTLHNHGAFPEQQKFVPLATTALEAVSGRLLVHEHKNTDVCKKVAFQALVCFDSEAYVQALGNLAKSSGAETGISSALNSSINGQVENSMESKQLPSEPMTPTSRPGSPVALRSANLPRPSSDILLPTLVAAEANAEAVSTSDMRLTVEPLVVETTPLDAGKVEVSQRAVVACNLCNQSNDCVTYEVRVADENNGLKEISIPESLVRSTIEPLQSRRIDINITPSHSGRQQYTVLIANVGTGNVITVPVSVLAHLAQYLRFPALEDSQELYLGYCYVDPGRKYAKTTPLVVENISDEDIYISCQSNLAQQVSIFLDENAEKGQVFGTYLKKRSMMTVWVALQPNLLVASLIAARGKPQSSSSGGSDKGDATAALLGGESRTLIGGIKFSVSLSGNDEQNQESRNRQPLVTQTVKFSSIIGQSIMQVSDKVLHLGTTNRLNEILYGSFTLSNLSPRLPLAYQVESPSGCIILDRSGGVLDGWDCTVGDEQLPKPEVASASSNPSLAKPGPLFSRSKISFRLTPTAYGLFRDKIIVTNRNHSAQAYQIDVRLFVDPGILTAFSNAEKRKPSDLEEDEGEAAMLPRIAWNTTHVSVIASSETAVGDSGSSGAIQGVTTSTEAGVEESVPESIPDSSNKTNPSDAVILQKSCNEDSVPTYEKCFEIVNSSATQELLLLPLSDLDTTVRWAFETGELSQSMLAPGNDSVLHGQLYHPIGTCLPMKPQQKAYMYLSCPKPSTLLASQVEKLADGNSVTCRGTLIMENVYTHMIIKSADLFVGYAVSRGEIEPQMMEVGKVGHFNTWEDVNFTFVVNNSSDCPLFYEIQSPSCIDIVKIDGEPVINEPMHCIANRRYHTVEAAIRPKRIEDFSAGPRTFTINLINAYNPENLMTFTLNATLTSSELLFQRLQHGELVLPQLYHPQPRTPVSCDTWFAVTNTSNEDLRFEIGLELQPEVMKYINVDILSRFSNSPLTGAVTLSPRGSIEVRVVAFPREDSRLPNDTSSYLVDPDGITFGRLWVATKKPLREFSAAQEGFAAPSVTEDITLRGVIVAGPTFVLSEKRIEFQGTLSDSDDEWEYAEETEAQGERKAARKGRRIKVDDEPVPTERQSVGQKESFTILNLSKTFPLEFVVSIEGPMEVPAGEILKVGPLDGAMQGRIDPGGICELQVELLNSKIGLSEDLRVCVRDLNSLCSPLIVYVAIASDGGGSEEGKRRGKKETIPLIEATEGSSGLPLYFWQE